MSAFVLDASAVLALLHREPGWEQVSERLGGAMISAVNWVEVLDKLNKRGANAEDVRQALDLLQLEVRDFTRLLAEDASALLPATKAFGLSLADRACLSLAKRARAIALTADRVWAEVQDVAGVEVWLIRHSPMVH